MFSCKNCYKSFTSNHELKDHRKREHGDSCGSCGAVVSGGGANGSGGVMGGLVGGGTNGGGGVTATPSVAPPPPIHYQCTVCGKSMKNAAKLYAHFTAAHTGAFNATGGLPTAGDLGGLVFNYYFE